MTYDRISNIIPAENIFIITNEEYADITYQQLPEVAHSNILLESQRRNTAPCIAWASYHIRKLNPQAVMLVAPCDHIIFREEEFARTIERGFEFVQHNNRLLTIGIPPKRPETGYGYIQVSDTCTDGVCDVKTFVEKPDYDMACLLVESGEFLWNSGIFIWKVKDIVEAFEKHLPDHATLFRNILPDLGTEREAEAIQRVFAECRAISIDYGVMEMADNVYVHCGDIGWSDVGTWGSVYQHSRKDRFANATSNDNIKVYDTRNSLITIPEGKIAVVSGLKDYIVVDTEDVLMICPMSDEQNIKSFIEDVKYDSGDIHI
jgi:mannose-1-phosphate guanylyltransferase